MSNIRNIAIIAHVDHGKTTLVDQLLHQSGTITGDMATRVMDSNDLEKERGITILAKTTAIQWRGCRINIVDTPGHADFGGEVERILSMVDSVVLLVDSVEGPMPQTRFVTQKAFQRGLKPIVVVNKIDRPQARPDWVVDKVFDLFDELGANDDQLDFHTLYASALAGFATDDATQTTDNMHVLLDTLIDQVPAPTLDTNGPFQMQVSLLDYSTFLGVIGIGRVQRGEIGTNKPVKVIDRDGQIRSARVLKLFTHYGLQRVETEVISAGDIVCVTGCGDLNVSDTICDPEQVDAMPSLNVDEPTISMNFGANQSPFSGKEGKWVTSTKIKERLIQEAKTNVALKVEVSDDQEVMKVSGRGELHLGILIEQMRREGFELSISRPKVIEREGPDGKEEPYERVELDIDVNHQGAIMEQMASRGGQLKDMIAHQDRVELHYMAPTRGLIGFQTQFITLTSGTGIMAHVFDHYGPISDTKVVHRKRGVLIANGTGAASTYALFSIQERGRLLIGPQAAVYEGMVIGINSRDNDLVVNVQKAKQLTNFRASGSDENLLLTPPVKMTLEDVMAFIADDELMEVTPQNIRVRKRHLKESDRKRFKKD